MERKLSRKTQRPKSLSPCIHCNYTKGSDIKLKDNGRTKGEEIRMIKRIGIMKASFEILPQSPLKVKVKNDQ